eukprot:Hpha_TRINITY_DN7865_c0_g1::TRINITY_DN7865_c0_g1_i1::g.185501::m.185501
MGCCLGSGEAAKTQQAPPARQKKQGGGGGGGARTPPRRKSGGDTEPLRKQASGRKARNPVEPARPVQRQASGGAAGRRLGGEGEGGQELTAAERAAAAAQARWDKDTQGQKIQREHARQEIIGRIQELHRRCERKERGDVPLPAVELGSADLERLRQIEKDLRARLG